MGRKVRSLWLVAAAAAVTVGAALLLFAVWRSPHRNDLIAYWGLVATVVTIVTGWISWMWRTRARKSADAVDEAALNHIADVLARAVAEQWTRAAADRGLLAPEPIPVRWHRPSVPLAGPAAAAATAGRFGPLSGMTLVTEAQLAEGDIGQLHQLYGGLGSGRLVISGAPGSGKSGAAVLMILAALAYRAQVAEADRAGVPVPVMFTLHGWDPVSQPVQDWLAVRLGQTYPALAGPDGAAKAARLLAAGKMAVILDGLDEIPPNLQPAALRALSQQATFRLVILSRTSEMAAAAAQSHLDGAVAVELQDVAPTVAAYYLTRVQLDPLPQSWSELIGRLHRAPASPLAQALDSPLTLGLLRDTYRDQDDVRELLDFCDTPVGGASRDEIIDHLLDRVLPAAYAHQPGQSAPRYDLQKAQHALSQLAAQMNQEGTRDLRWWNIPNWVTAAPRALTALAAVVLTVVLAIIAEELLTTSSAPSFDPERISLGSTGTRSAFGIEFVVGVQYGLMFGFVLGLAFWFTATRGHRRPQRIRLSRPRQALHRNAVRRGLVPGVIVMLGIGLVAWFETGNVAVGLTTGAAAGLATALVFIFSGTGADDASSVVPVSSWHNDLAFGLAVGFLVGLVLGIVSGLAYANARMGPPGVSVGLEAGLGGGLGTGLAIGIVLMLFSTRTWQASLAFAQLAVRWHTPPRLMRFLEDARQRNVLRIIGPVYQFRHARLQDRLAGQAYLTAGQPDPPVLKGRNAP